MTDRPGPPLGAFSLSLPVKDIDASRQFYETVGFGVVAGDAAQGWLILRSGDCTLGLFQGHIEAPLLTFNPGWRSEEESLAAFEDVRAIQARLRAAGVAVVRDTDPEGTGPANITVADPDGHLLFFDQHVPAPGRAPEE